MTGQSRLPPLRCSPTYNNPLECELEQPQLDSSHASRLWYPAPTCCFPVTRRPCSGLILRRQHWPSGAGPVLTQDWERRVWKALSQNSSGEERGPRWSAHTAQSTDHGCRRSLSLETRIKGKGEMLSRQQIRAMAQSPSRKIDRRGHVSNTADSLWRLPQTQPNVHIHVRAHTQALTSRWQQQELVGQTPTESWVPHLSPHFLYCFMFLNDKCSAVKIIADRAWGRIYEIYLPQNYSLKELMTVVLWLDLTCKIIEYSDWIKKAENWVQASI